MKGLCRGRKDGGSVGTDKKNVNDNILKGSIPLSIKCAMRYVKTLVFPDPAPAITIEAPSVCFTASSCWGLRDDK